MEYRKIEQIEADINRLMEERASLKHERDQQIAQEKERITAEFAGALQAKHELLSPLRIELEAAKSANASHPLEGKIAYREKKRRSQYLRGKDKTIHLRGIVTVIRTNADLPERKINDRYARLPEIGDVIIQRVDAKGNKLKGWEKIHADAGDGLPRGWKLEEENA